MTDPSQVQEDGDMVHAETALRRAAAKARELGRRTHTPVWVVRDGHLVDLTEEEEKAAREAESTARST